MYRLLITLLRISGRKKIDFGVQQFHTLHYHFRVAVGNSKCNRHKLELYAKIVVLTIPVLTVTSLILLKYILQYKVTLIK